MKAALVIVDVQEDFLPPHGSLAVQNGRDVIPQIQELCQDPRWACIAASMDWHPHDHCLFASTQRAAPFSEVPFSNPKNSSVSQTLPVWPDHCVQETFGAQVAGELEGTLACVQVPFQFVHKGMLRDREYFSAFTDVWGLHQTGLERFLRENGASKVFFVGIAYDYCVLNSALDGARLGFDSYVLKDLCKSVSPLLETDSRYSAGGVTVCTLADLGDVLGD